MWLCGCIESHCIWLQQAGVALSTVAFPRAAARCPFYPSCSQDSESSANDWTIVQTCLGGYHLSTFHQNCLTLISINWCLCHRRMVGHKKRIGAEGLSFYHPNLLCCLDQLLAVMELSQHLVLSSKTVRPIIPRSARCMRHVKIMWSAICPLAPHSHFAEGARPHLCMDELKRSTPVRRRLSLTVAVLVKFIEWIDRTTTIIVKSLFQAHKYVGK